MLTSKWLWAAVSVSLLLQVIIVYTPVGSTTFKTAALGWEQWGVLIAGLTVGFVATTLAGKVVVRRLGPI